MQSKLSNEFSNQYPYRVQINIDGSTTYDAKFVTNEHGDNKKETKIQK